MIHPLHSAVPSPSQFTYPFFYTPHALCCEAASLVQAEIERSGLMAAEQCGKMFGVLVVEYTDSAGLVRRGFLAAYSGLLAGRNDWPFYVPPVFDAQQSDGHFKQQEREISAINAEIKQLEENIAYSKMKAAFEKAKVASDNAVAQQKQKNADAKQRRDRRRHEAMEAGATIPADEQQAMIHESQHLKAELRRLMKRVDEKLEAARLPIEAYRSRISLLHERRRQMSDQLQRWLFTQYDVLNARGEHRSLVDIFDAATHSLPPAGAGDCCAPKLLQYAYAQGLKPLCMAEFWWGESPRQEIRHHLHYYPACRSKCLPILAFMLQGLDVEPNPLARSAAENGVRIVYEDQWLAVVDKPAGMLSVPGKDPQPSVDAFMRDHWHLLPDTPIMPHRLDRDTSGLLVVARTVDVYIALQRQFANREVKKRYEAVLDGVVHGEGCVSLPLIADISDRPRQRVDKKHGKKAVTFYKVVDADERHTHVWLYPHTGRTHQLRVHCAHRQGLDCPILGDLLYGRGTPAKRMFLHAAEIEFRHPVTGKVMHFVSSDWTKGV